MLQQLYFELFQMLSEKVYSETWEINHEELCITSLRYKYYLSVRHL